MKSKFFKIVIFSIFFIFANISLYANEIDSLQTFEDVQRFLKKKITKKHNDWDFSQKPGNDSSYLGKKEFIKLDLDDNGLTDILVNDRPIFAITDNGNDYNVHYFGEGIFDHNTYTLKTIVYKESIPLLIFDKKSRSEFRTDTLIFKFGGVIEYNSKPDNFKIEEIRFKAGACFGTCPIFEITIKDDRTATYDAIEYNDVKGIFKTIVSATAYDTITDIINYIRLTSLNDYYNVPWTDDRTLNVEIKFSNGEIKKISDYGGKATFGLKNLYDQFFALRESQQWE